MPKAGPLAGCPSELAVNPSADSQIAPIGTDQPTAEPGGIGEHSATPADPQNVFCHRGQSMMLIPVLGAASVVAGPCLLAAAERTTGTTVAASRSARTALTAGMSVAAAGLGCIGLPKLGATPIWVAWCWACALGCGLTLTDLRCRRLPFPMVAALAGGGAALLLFDAIVHGTWIRFGFACASMVALLGLALLVQVCAPEHTGGGDTALYAALGLYLGWFGWDGLLRGLLIASGLTALVALAVTLSSKSMNSRFPAGPPLLVGSLASILLT
ncbi:methyltransferase [Amycolatopsis rubida]|nr:methyltransferase [Amycolatopsis rubida]